MRLPGGIDRIPGANRCDPATGSVGSRFALLDVVDATMGCLAYFAGTLNRGWTALNVPCTVAPGAAGRVDAGMTVN